MAQQGFLGSQPFWLDRNGIANLVLLSLLKSKHWVTYDSTKNNGAFIVHTLDGEIHFKRCPDTGFPYIDLDDVSLDGFMLVQTIRGNYEGFTKRDIIKTCKASKLQSKLGQLCGTKLKQMLKEKEKGVMCYCIIVLSPSKTLRMPSQFSVLPLTG